MTKPKPPFTPFVFLRRGRVWTIVYPGPGGKKVQKATKLRGADEEPKARRLLAAFTERWSAQQIIEHDAGDGPLTVTRWAKQWLRTREVKGISTVKDYRDRLELHILPIIGHVRLDKVTPDHIDEVMGAAADKAKALAPRTQRHVYFTMRAMFNRAVPRLLDRNPCAIATDELPANKDADPEWRAKAIFTREEVQQLVTDDRIPEDRRVFYAVMFLGAMRFGEVAGLRVRNYRPELRPLGQIQISWSWHSDRRELKSVKTDRPRLMPVHPWLAEILDRWLAVGWGEMMGRQPGPDDILIPTRRNTHRGRHNGWQQLNGRPAAPKRGRKAVPGDLERLGMRPRRQHDTRRTFISLARGDGGRKDLLRLVTHGPEGDVVDAYTEMPWAALCLEVAKLRLGPPAPPPLSAVPKASESLGPGLPSGCHVGEPFEIAGGIKVTPPGIETGRNHSTIEATGGQVPQTPDLLGPHGRKGPAQAASGGQTQPLATLATLALRQALAALDRGRVDQAKDILSKAVAAEAADARARAKGGRS